MDHSATTDLENDLGGILARMASLTGAQQTLLARIATHPDPVTVNQLAEEAGLHVSSVRETLDILHARGLVRRETLPAHGRGRPALGYTTFVPADPSFAAQLLEQFAQGLFAWLHASGGDAMAAARELGRHWGEEALAQAKVPDHSTLVNPNETFALDKHMGKIRLFLTALGFAAKPAPGRSTSIVLSACPLTSHSQSPDPLALEMRRGFVERVLALTSSGTTEVIYEADEEDPLVAVVTLVPRVPEAVSA
ncbi:MarR family transcriptional regulator [Schaalia sp. 19OD2882]|uniref:helix-turn-helix transcriptional regulator n=1 Tax=Schaalia sp. 19OD2882 TaxID=2794089 RepID=UPI001C1EE0D3|nr:MarR family transcriptional regulator [Schaalia sp. 19OD2882]QWW19415.1 MarR family transcriptional regulator [Schaalia sp. 19OD2882]